MRWHNINIYIYIIYIYIHILITFMYWPYFFVGFLIQRVQMSVYKVSSWGFHQPLKTNPGSQHYTLQPLRVDAIIWIPIFSTRLFALVRWIQRTVRRGSRSLCGHLAMFKGLRSCCLSRSCACSAGYTPSLQRASIGVHLPLSQRISTSI